jgi:UDP-glucose 6-dehydrogenase
MTSDIKQLRSKDVTVLWDGANDVYRNNSQDALKHITSFVNANSHTNIIILCVPHRHDLPEWSCVNKEVEAFNRKLVKLMKPYKHVTVVKADLEREFFTRHGQHINNLGKEKKALRIVRVITDLFSNREERCVRKDGVSD